MNARFVPVLMLPICTAATAVDEETSAVAAHITDMATTYAAISRGATELNPIGPNGLLIAKPLVYALIKQQPKTEQAKLFSVYGAWGWGATANNLCVLASGGLCAVVGLFAGLLSWQMGAAEREYWELCNRVKHREPADMEC